MPQKNSYYVRVMEETNDKKWCVYMHTNKINNKVYVGQTCKKPMHRWNNGKGYQHNSHFWSAINKYGWVNFEHIIFAENLSQEEANHMEKLLIALYNTTDPSCGYNLTIGGEVLTGEYNPFYGKKHTDETKQKISEKAKNRDKTVFNTNGLLLGRGTKYWTSETYDKLSQANQGEKSATAKLTEKDVIDILHMLKNGCRHSEIKDKYDVADSEISRIKHKKRWIYLYDMFPELYDFPKLQPVTNISPNNTSGFIGVNFDKRCNRWFATIVASGVYHCLGRFDNKEDAIRARLKGELQYFGGFAPQKHLFKEYEII
jgi:group I intron endonuclease